MDRFLSCFVLVVALAFNGLSMGNGLDIRIIDGKVSIQAEAVPLSRLLRLLDQATGMTSKVPSELTNKTITVRFSNLNFEEAINKIFEGQPLDYVVVEGKSIIVIGTSQSFVAGGTSDGPPSSPLVERNLNEENPWVQDPPVVQTPFGTFLSPRENPPMQQQDVDAAPTRIAPNPFNNPQPGFNRNGQLPSLQGNSQFGSSTPTPPPNPVFNP